MNDFPVTIEFTIFDTIWWWCIRIIGMIEDSGRSGILAIFVIAMIVVALIGLWVNRISNWIKESRDPAT